MVSKWSWNPTRPKPVIRVDQQQARHHKFHHPLVPRLVPFLFVVINESSRVLNIVFKNEYCVLAVVRKRTNEIGFVVQKISRDLLVNVTWSFVPSSDRLYPNIVSHERNYHQFFSFAFLIQHQTKDFHQSSGTNHGIRYVFCNSCTWFRYQRRR